MLLKNKLTTRFLLSAMTAATLLISTANTVKAAGDEVVDFSITQNRNSYEDTLDDGNKENLSGKTVIISTNDVHGAITDFAYVAGLKNKMEERGATVILVDSGDFTNYNTTIVNYASKSDDA